MARPEEKANAMMNKWVKMREAGNQPYRPNRAKRPNLASECDHLEDAERYRRQILREIADLISKIQNPGLGEHLLRDTNDEINRKLREKHHWNNRIRQLGGPNFTEMELQQQIENSSGDSNNSILGSGGYRYFGAAKDLPGVRELFEKRMENKQSKQNRAELYRRITPDYFGWREEEDGVLLQVEAEYDTKNKNQRQFEGKENNDDDDDIMLLEDLPPLSKEIIAQAVLEQKKERLLSQLAL